jgi:hypothetical protein
MKEEYKVQGNEVIAFIGGLYKGTLKCLDHSDANAAKTLLDIGDEYDEVADRMSAEWVY